MPLDPLKFSSYRQLLKEAARSQGVTYKAIAAATAIHPSYFSRVMKERAEFSADQRFLVGRYLQLEGWRLEYWMLLGELDASANHKHRQHVQEKLDGLRHEHQRLSHRLKAERSETARSVDKGLYYEEALTAKVHMHLTLPKFRQNTELVTKKLGITRRRLDSELSKLEKLGIIAKRGTDWSVLQENLHLDEADPLSNRNQINWRIEVINKLVTGEASASDYHFAVVFSTTEAAKRQIKERFKAFIVEAQEIVGKASGKGEEDVFALTFDLQTTGAK